MMIERLTVQTLITTMNLSEPLKLIEKMNVQGDFLIGNQGSITSNVKIEGKSGSGLVLSRCERGVGRNRNVLLENAKADICVLADDDMRFVDGYPRIVSNLFLSQPSLDVAIFNLKNSTKRQNSKSNNIGIFNYGNYGAARIAFRRKAISYNGIFFNVNFGGGTQHQCGEDSLFLRECLKKRLSVKTIPSEIAELLEDRESTWFNGYTEQYLFDKGVFLGLAHPYLAKPFALYLSLRHNEYKTDQSGSQSPYKTICRGINYIIKKEYKKYEED